MESKALGSIGLLMGSFYAMLEFNGGLVVIVGGKVDGSWVTNVDGEFDFIVWLVRRDVSDNAGS